VGVLVDRHHQLGTQRQVAVRTRRALGVRFRCPDADAAYARACAAGATSVAEPADMFYGDRHAAVRDAAGNEWWMATHKEDVPPEELQRRAAAHSRK